MWVITRIQPFVDGRFEQALALVVEAEAEACPCCKSVLEATGALPVHCQMCGKVRGVEWQEKVEEMAGKVMIGKG